MKDALEYAVIVERLSEQDGGGYLAAVPYLPGCMSDGETGAEALANIHDAIEVWKAGARAMNRPIPDPAPARKSA